MHTMSNIYITRIIVSGQAHFCFDVTLLTLVFCSHYHQWSFPSFKTSKEYEMKNLPYGTLQVPYATQTTPKNMPWALTIHCIAETHEFLGSPNAFVLCSRAYDLFLKPWDAFSATLEDSMGVFITIMMIFICLMTSWSPRNLTFLCSHFPASWPWVVDGAQQNTNNACTFNYMYSVYKPELTLTANKAFSLTDFNSWRWRCTLHRANRNQAKLTHD